MLLMTGLCESEVLKMKNIDYESIGLRIKHYRSQVKHYSQEELAEKTQMSRSFLAQIENNSRIPSLETLIAIANALEVSANDLLVDNLINTGASIDSNIHYLLLDCTEEEASLITKTARELRKILRDYQIK